MIVGSNYGDNVIDGGDGTDWLYGNGIVSILIGGDGTDYLQGNGYFDHLYGGDGPQGAAGSDIDLFSVANGSFVMDAGVNDYLDWGPFHVTGGGHRGACLSHRRGLGWACHDAYVISGAMTSRARCPDMSADVTIAPRIVARVLRRSGTAGNV